MDLFRVRLNCIDHYQAVATCYDPQLRNDIRPSQVHKGPKVPVIRVFGSTETGQKVCAHIHGAFPYLYVEYQGSIEPDEVGSFIYRLHLSIDHALAVSYRRDQYGDHARFVARITLVKGVPFYGFHVGYCYFLKIYMFNPIVMTRLADLLQQGVIMKRKFQPYEAHLQYLLQFMTDYNLYGCDYLDASKASFRAPIPEHETDSLGSSHKWHSSSIPPEQVTDDLALPRVSHCSIEIDICVQHITNRKMIEERQLHQDFIERHTQLDANTKLVSSMAGLWRDEAKRRKRQISQSSRTGSAFPPEALVSMSAEPRDTQPQNWIHEEEYRAEIAALISREKEASGFNQPKFETFAERLPLEEKVNTALQSVEDLFPSTLMPALGLPSPASQADIDQQNIAEVDEQSVLQVQVDDDDIFPDDSDGESPDQTDLKHELAEQRAEAEQLGAQIGVVNRPPTGQEPDSPSEEPAKAGLALSDPSALHLRKKRVESPDSTVSSPKRVRLNGRASPGNSLVDAAQRNGMFLDCNTSPGHLGSLSQTSTGSRNLVTSPGPDGTRTLNFAVVKHPHDQATRMRLSQKSGQTERPVDASVTPARPVAFAQQSSQATPFTKTPRSVEAPSRRAPSRLEFPTLMASKVLSLNGGSPTNHVLGTLPPSSISVKNLEVEQLPNVLYQDAFYGDEVDVPPRIREYAGREFQLESKTIPFLPDFDHTGFGLGLVKAKREPAVEMTAMELLLNRQRWQCSWQSWEFVQPPPSRLEVATWFHREHASRTRAVQAKPKKISKGLYSQIDGPTQKNKHGFKFSQRTKGTSVKHEIQYMSTMSLEIHVNTRGKLCPNPEEDEIQCIFWALKSDEAMLNSQDPLEAVQSGVIVLSTDGVVTQEMRKALGTEIMEEDEELGLMTRMIDIVRTYDPDILTGYEVHGSSWGYLIERARVKYDYNLCDEFSRVKSESHGRFGKENDRWGFNTTSTIRVTGRHMINIWRAMRGELNLLQYTMENVAWHLLHRRLPHYPWKVLTRWYESRKPRELGQLLRYYLNRTKLDIEILEANDLIARTSEQARLLGVDFFSVFSRGSQFKVESIMFRIAKPENFMLVSPSRKQVGGQNALECLPLVMEPQSAFYSSPLLVLDFQSLYPSVMIAYNLCYSTFLGRITNWRGMNKMGFKEYKRQQGLLVLLEKYINIAPNGMMYAKTEIRKSLLAKMLTEILETRVMVKTGMKKDKDDKTLQKLLNNRQLALKLLANVTYGYTSASFSGRMPCSEIADSIVQTARETLERSIAFIHSVDRWGAEVVYGDTDSLFIHLKGKTRNQAFDIGEEICTTITNMNPRPVKLKFEKVYHPCLLMAKKRYVGYKYETRSQVRPDFDAKGIETVRRDGTPAEQKIEERALKLLFETADLSQIKSYFQDQCEKIMRGAVSVQDFCFAREVRLGTYSDKGPPPAGALISTRRMLEDTRAEPQYGERVPYVVVSGAPGARLIDRCVSPEELLSNPQWQLDAEYYISKNLIPPLERIFNLVGANVRQWYDEMPKVIRIHQAANLGHRKATLESYMRSTHCLVCNVKFTTDTGHTLCPTCRDNHPASLLALQTRLAREERKYQEVITVCQSCAGLSPLEDVRCDSKDCPVFWTRIKQATRVRGERASTEPAIRGLMEAADKAALEW